MKPMRAHTHPAPELNSASATEQSSTPAVALDDRAVRELKERLWHAAEVGDLDGVLQALRDGADPNSDLESSNETPLILAIHSGAKRVVAALIDAGADVEGPPKYEGSPLMAAIEATAGSLKRADTNPSPSSDATIQRSRDERNAIVELLLASGADPARRARSTEGVLLLDEFSALARANSCATPFWRAFFLSDTEWLARLAALLPQRVVDEAAVAIAKKSRDVGCAGPVSERICCAALEALRATLSDEAREALAPIWRFMGDKEGHAALIHSILYENIEGVRAAIKRAVPLNACAPGELTPLAVAVDARSPECVELLLDAGASVSFFMRDDLARRTMPRPCRDVLSFAVRQGATDCVAAILRHGRRQKALTGASPLRALIQDALFIAAWHIKPDCMALLAPHATPEEIEATATQRLNHCRGDAQDAATVDELLSHLNDSPQANALIFLALDVFSSVADPDGHLSQFAGRAIPLRELLPRAFARAEAVELREAARVREDAGTSREGPGTASTSSAIATSPVAANHARSATRTRTQRL